MTFPEYIADRKQYVIDTLTEKGSTVSLITSTTGYNTSTGKVETIETSTSTKGLISSFSSDQIQGEVAVNDIKIMLSSENEVKQNDIIDIDGKRYRVFNPMPLIMLNQTIYFQAHLKGS